MSPTRRDIIKASAGAVAAAMMATQVPAPTPVSASATILPEGEIRKATVLGMFVDQGSTDGTVGTHGFELFFDGDLDNTWTLWAHPQWRQKALFGEHDDTGIINCRGLSADDMMSRVWCQVHLERPKVLEARHFPGIFDLARSGAVDGLRKWIQDDSWLYESDGPESHDTLNERWRGFWQLVIWNHPILNDYPGFNAVIAHRGYYYLAVLDPKAVEG